VTSAADPVRPAAVVVLAAGEGTRMRSATPKVLHALCGRTLLGHVVEAARALAPDHLVAVVGHAREAVTAHLAEIAPEAVTAHQTELLGTGNAVRRALEVVPEGAGTVVVLNGDAPLLTPETLRALVDAHAAAGNAATVLSAAVPDPTGLGRIVRDADGGLAGIVEERDATAEQRAITEINSGMFAFDGPLLRTALKRLTTDNAQGQEYLTDVVALLRGDGHPVAALVAADHRETLGCNDRVELSRLRALLRDRLLNGWMREGVTVIDPATVWLDVDVVPA
jgi:bifunctional UDP-N-acetylglucosamine pyrophosphorylase / glucosamine-1-phosphate N-acetyltransferase